MLNINLQLLLQSKYYQIDKYLFCNIGVKNNVVISILEQPRLSYGYCPCCHIYKLLSHKHTQYLRYTFQNMYSNANCKHLIFKKNTMLWDLITLCVKTKEKPAWRHNPHDRNFYIHSLWNMHTPKFILHSMYPQVAHSLKHKQYIVNLVVTQTSCHSSSVYYHKMSLFQVYVYSRTWTSFYEYITKKILPTECGLEVGSMVVKWGKIQTPFQ